MNKKIAILSVILITIAILGFVYYPEIYTAVNQLLGSNEIGILLFAPNGQQITNGSVSVITFYPTEHHGTLFKRVYNDSHKGVFIFHVHRLQEWAGNWTEFNKKHNITIYPSIIIFASYVVPINSTTLKVLTQSLAVPLNVTKIAKGQGGEVINVVFTNPTVKYVNVSQVKQAAEGMKPQASTTTTTITTTPTTSVYAGIGYDIWYYPSVIAWYPNSSSVAPLAIATIVGPPNTGSYVASIAASFITQLQNSFNIKFYISQPNLPSNLESLVPNQNPPTSIKVSLPGPSITLYSSSNIIRLSTSNYSAIGNGQPYDIAQLYIMGQFAVVNYTGYLTGVDLPIPYPIGWVLQVMLTGIVASESGSAYAPIIRNYTTYAYDTSYSSLPNLSNGGEGGLPLLPVLFNNLTKLVSLGPGSGIARSSLTLYGTNAGWSLSINVGAILLRFLGPIGLILSAVNIVVTSQTTIIGGAVSIFVSNWYFANANLNIYYSNYSALYNIGGQYYIIPTNVYYLNYST